MIPDNFAVHHQGHLLLLVLSLTGRYNSGQFVCLNTLLFAPTAYLLRLSLMQLFIIDPSLILIARPTPSLLKRKRMMQLADGISLHPSDVATSLAMLVQSCNECWRTRQPDNIISSTFGDESTYEVKRFVKIKNRSLLCMI